MTAAKVEAISDRTARPVHVAAEQAQPILTEQLCVAPWNARKTFDAASLDELTASIQTQGLLTPLIVRPFESLAGILREPAKAAKSSQLYEIVTGHRRFRAVTKLNWKTVSCIVREMSLDEAREIGLVENVQRVDVPALEEADAYSELKKRLGTPAAIAARVRKEVSYVARRLQLVSLAEMPRKALAERLIAVDHALLLARLGDDEQSANLKWALDRNAGVKMALEKVVERRIKDRDKAGSWKWEPESPQRLKEHIEQHVGRKLSRAPWGLDDAKLLPDVGTCSACPSNTAANDTLFGDLNIDKATCADGGCFEAKRAKFVQICLSETTKKNLPGRGPAVRLSWKETGVKPRFSEAKAGSVMVDESGVNLMQTFKRGQWVEAKPKSCQFVRLGVTVDWSDDANRGYMGSNEKLRKPGQELIVCIAPGCKAHKKKWEKPKQSNGSAPYDAKAEEAKRERIRVAALHETQLRVRLAGAAIEKVTKLPEQLLRRFLIDQLSTGNERKAYEAVCPGLEKAVRSAALDSVAFARAVATLSIEGRHLEVWEHWEAKTFRAEFITDLKLLGYDASKGWDKAVEKPAAKVPAKKVVKKAAKKVAKKKGGK